MANGSSFNIKIKRLKEVCNAVLAAASDEKGIFYGGFQRWKRYLPQWNLPGELEYFPQGQEVRKPYEASTFLFQEVQMERQNSSRYLMGKAMEVWENTSTRWFFDPMCVADRTFQDTENIVEGIFRYRIAGSNEKRPALRIWENSQFLTDHYDGDPRNLIKGKTVEEARKNLMRFQGIGTGIANLYIIYLLDRNIASPTDPENILFKIDVHKGRIPINTGCITMNNGAKDVHVNSLVAKFEGAYKRVCHDEKLDPKHTDAVLWVLGSEVCSKRSYRACQMNCPLYHNGLCLSNVPLQQTTGSGSGRYVILDEDGKRMETRRRVKEKKQNHFFL